MNPTFIILAIGLSLVFLFFAFMNLYVQIKCRRILNDLERHANMVSSVWYDWKKHAEIKSECESWIKYGWPQPGMPSKKHIRF